MSQVSEKCTLYEVQLVNFLSFGPERQTLELGPLNLLIGPNASGKSNLVEALALMRATPILPQQTSSSDVQSVVRRGGGPSEWVWKGAKTGAAQLEFVMANGDFRKPLRHVFSFGSREFEFQLWDERVEFFEPNSGESEPYFFYRFQNGQPIVNTLIESEIEDIESEASSKPPFKGNSPVRRERKLARETVNLDISILAQRRDPERYPEITHLANSYERWRIYREWAFGRNTLFREPQRADARNDRLEEDFSNLGLFLSRLRRTPRTKNAIVEGLCDLYEGFTDFDVVVEGGAVQVFFTEGDFSIPATRLSDGTLRYLCLLAILCDPTPPPLICIEEPELGLHPDVLPKLADRLIDASAKTQLIVTTHSDILVDAMTERPEAVIVCEKNEHQTQMRRLQKKDLDQWLEKYRLGQLWTKGQIGGTRW
jgi:predicted ATPase